MFIAKDNTHTHVYTKLGFIREMGVDRVILIRSCSCGAAEAFECGSKDKMRRLYNSLAKVKPSTVS